MRRAFFATMALALFCTAAYADSEHECQGNSCNGSGGSSAVGVGVGLGVGISESSATAISVNDVSVKNTNLNAADGGSAHAKGGDAYNGGNSQSVTVTESGALRYSGSYSVKNTPNPPDVITNPTAPCRVAFSGSGSGAGFGIGIGGSVLDEGCNRRENARLLYNIGETSAAKLILCNEPEIAAVLPACPAQAPVSSKAAASTERPIAADGSVSLVGR